MSGIRFVQTVGMGLAPSVGEAATLGNWGRYGSTPWLSLWESCQPNRLTEREPQ